MLINSGALSWVVLVQAFNPGTRRQSQADLEASLAYRASSTTIKVTQRNPVSSKQANHK